MLFDPRLHLKWKLSFMFSKISQNTFPFISQYTLKWKNIRLNLPLSWQPPSFVWQNTICARIMLCIAYTMARFNVRDVPTVGNTHIKGKRPVQGRA